MYISGLLVNLTLNCGVTCAVRAQVTPKFRDELSYSNEIAETHNKLIHSDPHQQLKSCQFYHQNNQQGEHSIVNPEGT